MDYPVESYSHTEREQLSAHFTNLDRPVFALVNLPETVKGALFARYSRYPGTLRRLFLDEFAGDLPASRGSWDGHEGERAAQLYERIFVGYGDDSVAQLGGAHIACEWVSNVLTKILQRPRLGAYLEQSTRYIAYDAPMPDPPGGYRYYRDAELGPEYAAAMDELFSIYSETLPRVTEWAEGQFPRAEGEAARGPRPRDQGQGARSAARAAARQLVITHGDIRHRADLRAAGAASARAPTAGGTVLWGDDPGRDQDGHAQLCRPGRAPGTGWRVDRLPRGPRAPGARWARRLGLDRAGDDRGGPSVRLLRADGDEEDLLVALLFESGASSEESIRDSLASLDGDERAQLLAELVGERSNRRHRPGRGFEAIRYRFEIVSDYGAFRDLQRHRMLTVQWQPLTPDLGAGIPEQVELAGCGDRYRHALEVSRLEFERLAGQGSRSRRPTPCAWATESATSSI